MKGFSFIRTAAAIAVVAGAAGVVGAVSGAGTGASAASADRTADIVAIQSTQACYGRAQDVVYRNYANKGRAEREGLAAFGQCFTPGADVTITVHGTKLLDHAGNIRAWTQFVYQFGHTNGITSTRHLLGNIEVKLTGPNSASSTAQGSPRTSSGRAPAPGTRPSTGSSATTAVWCIASTAGGSSPASGSTPTSSRGPAPPTRWA